MKLMNARKQRNECSELQYGISTNTLWSMNTFSIACLPLCLLTCHISVIRTAIFQVPFLVCNSEIMFSLRNIATNKIKFIYNDETI